MRDEDVLMIRCELHEGRAAGSVCEVVPAVRPLLQGLVQPQGCADVTHIDCQLQKATNHRGLFTLRYIVDSTSFLSLNAEFIAVGFIVY